MSYNAGTKNRTTTDFIAVHCSATKPSMNIGAADIDRWHRQRGFKCLGYHFVIKRDGTVEEGRPVDQVGAHVENWNSVSVGVCMVGGVSEKDVNIAENNFTEAQFESLKKVVTDLKKRYPKASVQGHRDFPKVAKSCPSFDAKAWAKQNGF